MKILDKIILSIPLLTIFSGCPYIAAAYLGTKDSTEEHDCGCDRKPGDDAPVNWKRCDKDGNGQVDGEYICCATCSKICHKILDAAAKPPVPVPLPDCDKKNHCTVKEACKISDGPCCSKCHQACPPWSSEDE